MQRSEIGERLQEYLQDSFQDMLISEGEAKKEGGFVRISRPFTISNRDIEEASDDYELLGGISLDIYEVFTGVFAHEDFDRFTGFKVIQQKEDPSYQIFGVELRVETYVK